MDTQGLSQASAPEIAADSLAHARRRCGQAPAGHAPTEGTHSEDLFFAHYFSRLDPEVAASFTAEQRNAIRVMFGARGIARHGIEIRRSIPFLRGKRFYLVFLMGREKRGMMRLYREATVSRSFSFVFYLALIAVALVPGLALFAAFAR